MTDTVSRRAALRGVSALAAVIATPSLGIASSAHTLAALIEHWRGLQAAIEREGKAIAASTHHRVAGIRKSQVFVS